MLSIFFEIFYIFNPRPTHKSDHITPGWEYCGSPYCLENPVQTCKCVMPAPGAQIPSMLQPPLPFPLLAPPSLHRLFFTLLGKQGNITLSSLPTQPYSSFKSLFKVSPSFWTLPWVLLSLTPQAKPLALPLHPRPAHRSTISQLLVFTCSLLSLPTSPPPWTELPVGTNYVLFTATSQGIGASTASCHDSIKISEVNEWASSLPSLCLLKSSPYIWVNRLGFLLCFTLDGTY